MLLQAPTGQLPASHNRELAATMRRAIELNQIGAESLALLFSSRRALMSPSISPLG
jgi:hypothetical protein